MDIKMFNKIFSFTRFPIVTMMSIFLILISVCGSGSINNSAIIWVQSYSEAIAQAKLTGKPIFLEFRCVP